MDSIRNFIRDVEVKSHKIKYRVSFFLALAYIYHPLKNYYDPPSTGEERGTSGDVHRSAGEHHESKTEKEKEQVQRGRSRNGLCKFPEITLLTRYFTIGSSLVHLVSVLQMAILISETWGQSYTKPISCYFVGRAVFLPESRKLMPYFQFMCSLFNLVWRIQNLVAIKHYQLDCIPFLMSADQEQEEEKHSSMMMELAESGSPNQSNNLALEILYLELQTNQQEYVLKDNHFGLVIAGKKRLYIRRLNRTPRAKRLLVSFFNQLFRVTVIAGASIAGTFMPILVFYGVTDLGHMSYYPGCSSAKLEQWRLEGRLSAWSINGILWLEPHRLISLLSDVIVNLVVWGDDLSALLLPLSVAMILAKDLLIYWAFLRLRLDRLLHLLKLEAIQSLGSAAAVDGDSSSRHPSHWQRRHPPPAEEHLRTLVVSSRKLDAELYILQQEMVDFFRQLDKNNKYVSLMMTNGFIVFIVMFLASSYIAIKVDSFAGVLGIRLVQGIVLALISLPLYRVLMVGRHTKLAYVVVCAIMAYDQNPDRKRYWSHLINYYTDQRAAYGFTLAYKNQLTWLSLLKVIASTISFLIVIETYRRAI